MSSFCVPTGRQQHGDEVGDEGVGVGVGLGEHCGKWVFASSAAAEYLRRHLM
jgi:hypothetical protein